MSELEIHVPEAEPGAAFALDVERSALPGGWSGGPRRIQRKRTKGWRMPEGAVYVGRPSRWGNPFEADHFTPELAVDAFKVHLVAYFGWESRTVARAFYPWPVESAALRDWLGPLRSKDLACWCPLDQPCHADVLLELANA